MNDAANGIYSDDFIKLYTKFANNSFVGSRKSLLISKIKVKTVKIILSLYDFSSISKRFLNF